MGLFSLNGSFCTTILDLHFSMPRGYKFWLCIPLGRTYALSGLNFVREGSTHVLSCNVLHFYEAFPHLNELPFVYFSTFFSPRLHTRGVSSPRHALVTPQRFRLKEKELPSAIQGNDGAVLTSQSHNGDVDEQSLWTLAHIYGIINGLLKSLWVILHPLMS